MYHWSLLGLTSSECRATTTSSAWLRLPSTRSRPCVALTFGSHSVISSLGLPTRSTALSAINYSRRSHLSGGFKAAPRRHGCVRSLRAHRLGFARRRDVGEQGRERAAARGDGGWDGVGMAGSGVGEWGGRGAETVGGSGGGRERRWSLLFPLDMRINHVQNIALLAPLQRPAPANTSPQRRPYTHARCAPLFLARSGCVRDCGTRRPCSTPARTRTPYAHAHAHAPCAHIAVEGAVLNGGRARCFRHVPGTCRRRRATRSGAGPTRAAAGLLSPEIG